MEPQAVVSPNLAPRPIAPPPAAEPKPRPAQTPAPAAAAPALPRAAARKLIDGGPGCSPLRNGLAGPCGEGATSPATGTGRVTVRHDGRDHDVGYTIRGNRAFAEGDVLLADVDELGRGIISTGGRWPGAVIPYVISSPQVKSRVQRAVAKLNALGPLKLVERTAANAAQYPNYIDFVVEDGCWSPVGMKRGAQKISLAAGCDVGATMHEIMHASGVWHEQSRSDRDDYIKIVWDNIEPEERHNFEKHTWGANDVGTYDYGSIMHYSAWAFSKNGERTIIPKRPNASIGNRSEPSQGDLATLRRLYPR